MPVVISRPMMRVGWRVGSVSCVVLLGHGHQRKTPSEWR
jgi:hypothetical protein